MKRNKNGFTIVECVVAMAVMTIISATAVMTYMMASTSINDRWNRFRASVFGNNMLTFFQAADSMNGFDSFFEEGILTHSKEVEKTEEVSLDALKYDEYDPKNQIIPFACTSVKADKLAGKVTFYGGKSELLSFSYNGEMNAFTSDTATLGNTSVYNVSDEQHQFIYTYPDSGSLIVSTNASTTTISCDGRNKTYNTTSFEKYLLNKGWYLVLNNIDGKYFTFNAYNIYTNEKITSSQGDLLFRIKGEEKRNYLEINGKLSRLYWYNENQKTNMTVGFIKQYYSNNDSDTAVYVDGVTNEDWCFLTLLTDNTSYAKSKPTVGGNDYIVYQAKGDESSQSLAYALRTTSGVELYNASTSNGGQNDLMFAYSVGSNGLSSVFGTLPFSFTKVRVYAYRNKGKVTFYDKASNTSKNIYYSDKAKFIADTESSVLNAKNSKNENIYGQTWQNWSFITLTATNASDDRKTEYKISKNSSGVYSAYIDYRSISENKTLYKASYTPSVLEQNLFSDGIAIWYDTYSFDTDNKYIYFYAYSGDDGSRITDGNGKYLYYRVKYNSNDTSGDWYTSGDMSFGVIKVEYTYSSESTIQNLKKTSPGYTELKNGKSSYSFTWEYLPSMVYDTYKTSNYPLTNCTSVSWSPEYAEYTLKSGNGASTIGSITVDESGYVFYNSSNVALYHFTTEVTETNAAISIVKKIFPSEREITKGGNKYKQYYQEGEPLEIERITFDDANLKIKLGTASKDSVIFSYTKGDAATNSADYEKDKAEVISLSGKYHACYDNAISGTAYPLHDYTGEARTQSGISDNTVSPKIDFSRNAEGVVVSTYVVMRGDKIPDENEQFYQVVFASDTAVVTITEKSVEEVTLEKISVDTKIKYDVGIVQRYCASYFGNYACFAQITYSYSTNENDVGVGCTPNIKVWVIPSKQVPILNSESELDQVALDQIARINEQYEPFIRYYKG